MCKNDLFLYILLYWRICVEARSSPEMPEQGSGTLKGVHASRRAHTSENHRLF